MRTGSVVMVRHRAAARGASSSQGSSPCAAHASNAAAMRPRPRLVHARELRHVTRLGKSELVDPRRVDLGSVHAELAGLSDRNGETLASVAHQGFSPEQALHLLDQMVKGQSVTIATNQVMAPPGDHAIPPPPRPSSSPASAPASVAPSPPRSAGRPCRGADQQRTATRARWKRARRKSCTGSSRPTSAARWP